ncbi:MAG TPA: hypothetical protein VFA83_24815 [Acidimicrobiales bacterium]|nr:hypothetical protein [Acidimicrobiales bacterium]
MTRARPTVAAVVLSTIVLVAGCGSTVPLASRPAAARTGTASRDSSLGPASATGSETGAASAAISRGGSAGSASGVVPSGATTRATSPLTGTSQGSARAANHSPISLGVLYTVNDGAESAGINNGNNFTLKQAVTAFVDGYNAAGGIAGRRIQPAYAEVHSASNDYEAQTQAACSTFTQDRHVAAVIANVGYHSDILVSCLAKANVPLITGDWDAPDQRDADRYPLFVTPASIVGDTRVAAVVQRLAASGFLQPRNKVGAIVEDCPVDGRVYDNALVPALKRAGLTLAATYRPRCFQSIQDYGGQASDVQGAVLQFNRSGVDRVIVVSQAAEANIVDLFAQGADAQHYLPGYALSSAAAPAVLALNAPAGQLANMQGVGWLPASDTQNTQQAPPTSTAARCLALLQKQGLRPASAADYAYVYGPCDTFSLYEAALRATNGDSTTSAVMRALPVVGQTYVSASTVDGKIAVSPAGRIGAGAVRLFAWTGGRFQYTSGSFPL